MRLTIIGAGPAYTDRRGAAGASHLVQLDGASLLLDMGQGSFPNLASELEPSKLTAVLVSHLHPDHFVDLVALRHYLMWEVDVERPVTVLAPAGLAARLDGLDGTPDFAGKVLGIQDLVPGSRRFGPFEVEAVRVAHTDESYAFRVSAAEGDGHGLVYSGDCARAGDFAQLIRPGDTVLSEATFGAGPVPEGAEHITAGDAARVAADCGAGRLLLTHILANRARPDALAAAQSVFPGPAQLVTEGDRFEI
jgi:ribonuclease BN (tRNA processing enzyme)